MFTRGYQVFFLQLGGVFPTVAQLGFPIKAGQPQKNQRWGNPGSPVDFPLGGCRLPTQVPYGSEDRGCPRRDSVELCCFLYNEKAQRIRKTNMAEAKVEKMP